MLSPLTSLFRGWRAALLLVVVACATPGRATAECGDHVTVLNGQATNALHATPAPVGTPASPKVPCSGPNCSRLPDRPAPLPAPAPVSGPHGKELAHVLDLLGPSDLAHSSRHRPHLLPPDLAGVYDLPPAARRLTAVTARIDTHSCAHAPAERVCDSAGDGPSRFPRVPALRRNRATRIRATRVPQLYSHAQVPARPVRTSSPFRASVFIRF